jgi:hypothetical protein
MVLNHKSQHISKTKPLISELYELMQVFLFVLWNANKIISDTVPLHKGLGIFWE